MCVVVTEREQKFGFFSWRSRENGSFFGVEPSSQSLAGYCVSPVVLDWFVLNMFPLITAVCEWVVVANRVGDVSLFHQCNWSLVFIRTGPLGPPRGKFCFSQLCHICFPQSRDLEGSWQWWLPPRSQTGNFIQFQWKRQGLLSFSLFSFFSKLNCVYFIWGRYLHGKLLHVHAVYFFVPYLRVLFYVQRNLLHSNQHAFLRTHMLL